MIIIRESRLNAIKSTAKIILRICEEKLIENGITGETKTLIYSELAKMNDDYEICTSYSSLGTGSST